MIISYCYINLDLHEASNNECKDAYKLNFEWCGQVKLAYHPAKRYATLRKITNTSIKTNNMPSCHFVRRQWVLQSTCSLLYS